MTPKDKAKELFSRYYPLVYCFVGSGMLTNTEDGATKVKNAKRCALIAVDEILCTLSDLCCQSSGSEIIEPEIDYWQQVKNEIEKL